DEIGFTAGGGGLSRDGWLEVSGAKPAEAERAGERGAESEEFSACILAHGQRILTHDPASVLSELPGARVIPRRRRADQDGGRCRSAARRRSVPVLRRRARPSNRARVPHASARRLHRGTSRPARPRPPPY